MMLAVLKRKSTKDNIIGDLKLFNKSNQEILNLRTLELPFLDNKPFISAIPKGLYTVEKYQSPKFGTCFQVQDVPGRTYILFHPGNYTRNTKGCILVGRDIGDINKDGSVDVLHSKDAMKELLTKADDTFKLFIYE